MIALALLFATLSVLAMVTGGNIIQTIGVPIDSLVTYLPEMAHYIAFLCSFGDLIFVQGTLLLLVKVLMYFVYAMVNLIVIKFILKLILKV